MMDIYTNYGPFIDQLKKKFTVNIVGDDEILIQMGEYFFCRCTVSYNEPKVYFRFHEGADPRDKIRLAKYTRVLDGGERAAEYITKVAELYQAMEPDLLRLEYNYCG